MLRIVRSCNPEEIPGLPWQVDFTCFFPIYIVCIPSLENIASQQLWFARKFSWKKAFSKTSPILVVILTQGGEDCEDIWYGERKPRDDKGLRVHHHHQRVLQPDDGGLHWLRWNIWEKNYFQVFGPEKGVGARSAVGLATLPHNCPVEVECVFQIKKDVSFNKYCWIWPGKFKVIHCTIWQILLSINFYLFLWLCFLTSSQASLIC